MRYKAEFTKLEKALAPVLAGLNYEKISHSNRAISRQAAIDPFEYFVAHEWASCESVLDWYKDNVPIGSKVLDIGTFTGAIPLLLTWEGYQVSTVENYDLYSDGFDPLVKFLSDHGITVTDDDITSDYSVVETFDVIQVLAVLEHLHGSPVKVLKNLKNSLSDGGHMLLTVPNQARLGKRIQLLMGDSTMPEISDYLNSTYPFSGHHREYTFWEMEVLLSELQFSSHVISSIRYPGDTLAKKIVNAVAYFLPRTFHQMIFGVGSKGNENA